MRQVVHCLRTRTLEQGGDGDLVNTGADVANVNVGAGWVGSVIQGRSVKTYARDAYYDAYYTGTHF